MNEIYSVIEEENRYIVILNGVLRKESFISQMHLNKFVEKYVYRNNSFNTILIAKDGYTLNKIKRILDYNVKESFFINESDNLEFLVLN